MHQNTNISHTIFKGSDTYGNITGTDKLNLSGQMLIGDFKSLCKLIGFHTKNESNGDALGIIAL